MTEEKIPFFDMFPDAVIYGESCGGLDKAVVTSVVIRRETAMLEVCAWFAQIPAPAELRQLEELLADDSVTEIMVNGPHRVYVERGGKIQLTDLQFLDDASVMAIIERIVVWSASMRAGCAPTVPQMAKTSGSTAHWMS